MYACVVNAGPISYEVKSDILETKKSAQRVYNRIKQEMSKSYGEHDLTIRKSFKISKALKRTTWELYRTAVVKGKVNGRSIVFQDIIGNLKLIKKLYTNLDEISQNKIKSKYFKKRMDELAYHISNLVELLLEENIISSLGENIERRANAHKLTFEENRIRPEYKNYFIQLRKYLEQLETIYKFTKKKRRKRIHHPKDRFRYKIFPNYNDLYKLTSLHIEKVESILEELVQPLGDEDFSHIDLESLKKRQIDLNDMIRMSVEHINSFESTIDEKQELDKIRNLSLALNQAIHELDFSFNANLTEIKDLKKVKYKYERSSQICSLLGSPGNISLKRSMKSDPSLFSDFQRPLVARTIQLIEALKFTDIDITYSHAEIISKINSDIDIQSWSYYPWMFNVGKEEERHKPRFLNFYQGWKVCNNIDGCSNYDDYRKSSTMIRVSSLNHKKETRMKEDALEKLEKRNIFLKTSPLGVCSDFVNWLYDGRIKSNWNFIPGLKHLIGLVWLPEGWQTPDNLYNSYLTETVCERKEGELIYPLSTNLHTLVSRIKNDLNSKNVEIKNHAQSVLNELINKDLVSQDLKPLYDILEFEKSSLMDVNWEEW